ncbi:MAG: hypothetical protein A3K10_16095 [Bacteroidetes bacterium RIFCSPLOWO2_12_FULL_31_6]|nr:MAG: hypothetical protein A3K10_16095 [Bacteroidetes bacterium RIFCSPLOWO2_12_FULL_31_6]
MKKLKLKLIGMLFMFMLVSITSFSQNYEKQSTEVQNQMNLNKINGVSIWNDIVTSFNVYTEGLNSVNEGILIERIKTEPSILSTTIAENGKVILVCQGGTEFVSVKHNFSNIVTNITKIEENSYLQKQDNK